VSRKGVSGAHSAQQVGTRSSSPTLVFSEWLSRPPERYLPASLDV
jgi:hypothetical protein